MSEGDTPRPRRGPGRDFVIRLLRLPWRDPRFWAAQGVIVLAMTAHVLADYLQNRTGFPAPGLVSELLVFVAIFYAGAVFGLVGSLGTALSAVLVLLPSEFILPHNPVQVWDGWSIVLLGIFVALVVGARFEMERRQTEALLLGERARVVGLFHGEPLSWRGLFEAVSYGICIVDEHGVIRFINERLEDGAYYARGALVGQGVGVLVPLADELARSWGHAGPGDAAGAGDTIEAVLVRSDGAEVPVDIAFAPLDFAGESWFVISIHDASARVGAEQARVEAELHALGVETAANRELARGERRFRLAFEENTSSMAITDADGIVVDVNQAYCDMIGRTMDEVIGQHVLELTHPEDRQATGDVLRQLADNEATQVRYVKRYLHRDGSIVIGDNSTGIIRSEHGDIEGFVASVKDITEERELIAQLSHQALHDPLTGLANRALFEDRLTRALEHTARHGGTNALFLIDLDDFKGVNDTLGHHVGDALLVELARRLESVTRASDTLCRFGGDEFIYLAEGITSPPEEIAERLLSIFEEPFLENSMSLEQRASIGVVVQNTDRSDPFELIRDVDTAMYEAKRQGNGHYVVFNTEMNDLVSTRFELLRDLRRALALGQMSMHYQPLVHLVTEEIVGFEALMRWHHPRLGPVAPDVFIPLAEQSDLIVELGEFALNEAAAAAASWPPSARSGRQVHVSVNLSARQFHDPNLARTIEQVLSASGLASRRLALEITESATLSDVAGATTLIEDLERLGVTVALDDFGTGYSSLSYLAHLRPDVIKIDHSFVEPIDKSTDTNPLLESIILFGHQLGLTMVAEGIERPGQLDYLRHVGCDLGQGFLFSPAVPCEQVAELLTNTPWLTDAALPGAGR